MTKAKLIQSGVGVRELTSFTHADLETSQVRHHFGHRRRRHTPRHFGRAKLYAMRRNAAHLSKQPGSKPPTVELQSSCKGVEMCIQEYLPGSSEDSQKQSSFEIAVMTATHWRISAVPDMPVEKY